MVRHPFSSLTTLLFGSIAMGGSFPLRSLPPRLRTLSVSRLTASSVVEVVALWPSAIMGVRPSIGPGSVSVLPASPQGSGAKNPIDTCIATRLVSLCTR